MQVIRDLDEKKGKEKKEEAEGQREVRGGIGSQEVRGVAEVHGKRDNRTERKGTGYPPV